MRIPTAILLAACLSACTVGEDFHAPDAPTTASYTREGDITRSGPQKMVAGAAVIPEWWGMFASKSLDETVRQSLADNNDLAAARETLAQVEESVAAANGALWPQLGLDASVVRQKYGVALFGPSNFVIPPFTAYQVGPTLSWAPDLFGGNRRMVEQVQALADYQRHVLAGNQLTLAGNVVAQALAIASIKAEIAATERILAEDKRNLSLVKATVQAGSGTKVEELSAQSQFTNDQTLLPALHQSLSVARHTLSVLVSKAPADWAPPDFTITEFTLPQELPLSLPSELVHQRPDILAAEANLHAASAAVGVATANLYPKITLTAATMQEALTGGGLFKSAANAWSLAAGLTAPIFDGGTLSAEKRAAEHAYQAALAQYRQTIIQAFGQVADTLTALQYDDEAIAAQQQAVDTGNASMQLARQSYQAGNTGILQILDAERLLNQAQLGLIRAQNQRYQDTVKLLVALGGTSPQADTPPSNPSLQENIVQRGLVW